MKYVVSKIKKYRKNKQNNMENTKESVYIFSAPINKIKKHILCRSMTKIKQIITMTNKIREDIYEFDQQIDIAPLPKTDMEQEKKIKKIDNFQEGIRKRWEEVWRLKEEIHTTTDIIYELSQIRIKYIGVAEEEQMSWADIRREILDGLKKSFCQ